MNETSTDFSIYIWLLLRSCKRRSIFGYPSDQTYNNKYGGIWMDQAGCWKRNSLYNQPDETYIYLRLWVIQYMGNKYYVTRPLLVCNMGYMYYIINRCYKRYTQKCNTISIFIYVNYGTGLLTNLEGDMHYPFTCMLLHD